jgi:hypothetical protein
MPYVHIGQASPQDQPYLRILGNERNIDRFVYQEKNKGGPGCFRQPGRIKHGGPSNRQNESQKEKTTSAIPHELQRLINMMFLANQLL